MNTIDISDIHNDLNNQNNDLKENNQNNDSTQNNQNNDLKENNQNNDLKENNQNNDFEEILDIANNVFNTLGAGFIENIYHKAMLIDLNKLNKYDIIETKKIIPISYKDINIGYVESDIVLHTENNIFILELKAFDRIITQKEISQTKKYINLIENNQNKVIKGIVINFNQKSQKIDHLLV